MSSVSTNPPKKPITKRWWFWAIIVVVALAVIGSLGDSSESGSSSDSAATEAKSEEAATAAASQESEQAEDPSEQTEEPSEQTEKPEAETVEFGGQEWTCLPVPEDLLGRLLDGSSYNVGDLGVDKSTMVRGVDNFFVAAEVIYPGDKTPFKAVFTSPIDGTGPITSATKGTAQLFNWPETPNGKLDGAYAAEKCLKKV
ncbi:MULTISPECIES: hypothetical protein [Corynebacterium]|uniref:Secreted protein n=1 Tax=Corynebacterium ihumii TaxID=1232427 RepID=A0ABY7UB58_9CORY|nr:MULTISPECIES: hypothetical protein [Corynebacterium]WCZ33626.1 hypothetical protein CIHUM_00890 [Corynebacterium ihumii]